MIFIDRQSPHPTTRTFIVSSHRLSKIQKTGKELKKGSVIKEKDIIPKRPGSGISPIHWNSIIGRKIKQDLKKDHILKFDNLID